MTEAKPEIGQIYKDNDPRLPDRRVEILAVGDTAITYKDKKTNRTSTSALPRFIKAFTLAK